MLHYQLSNEELATFNLYAQMRTQRQYAVAIFEAHTEEEKNSILRELWILAIQSGAIEEDIPLAAVKSGLELTHTPVVMALSKKQPMRNRLFHNFQGKVLNQALSLALECFAISQKRKYEECRSNHFIDCHHWWHKISNNT